MRNKSHLALMEQVLMVLVFALTAALCLQGFVLANHISTRMGNRNRAVTIAQNAAEIVKYYSGDFAQAAQHLNGEWNGHVLQADCMSTDSLPGTQSEVLHLEITPVGSSTRYLGTAQITVFQTSELLFEITVAWQEDN